MAKESEKVVERILRETVEYKGGICLKLLTSYFNGLPDRLVLLPGKIAFFVETKSTGDDPRKLQKWVHNKLRSLGFDVYVIDTAAKVKEIVSKYAK